MVQILKVLKSCYQQLSILPRLAAHDVCFPLPLGVNMRICIGLVVPVVMLVLATPVWPQTDSVESQIRAVMAQGLAASLAGDSDKMASLMAEEYLQTDISGHVQDKSTWFKEYFNPVAELIRAGKFRWEVYDRKDVQFRIYGDSAVVIGTLEAKGSGARWVPQTHTWAADPSASFGGTLRFTQVYIKQNGKWLLAALHNAVPFTPPPSHK